VLAGVPACDAPLEPEALAADDGESNEDDADADAAPEDAWDDPLPLVSGQAWAPAGAHDDPLADERPATVDCPTAAWGLEAGGLEIQTGACNYFFVTQPSLAAIEAGDAVDIVVFHQYLDAPEPAEGHVAILVGHDVVWEAHVEIPAEADVLEARVVAERAWPVGTPVGVHLHNHGYNAWTVLDVSVAPRLEG
jgi:hypothetical protein